MFKCSRQISEARMGGNHVSIDGHHFALNKVAEGRFGLFQRPGSLGTIFILEVSARAAPYSVCSRDRGWVARNPGFRFVLQLS
jgi:hypothetical protein